MSSLLYAYCNLPNDFSNILHQVYDKMWHNRDLMVNICGEYNCWH